VLGLRGMSDAGPESGAEPASSSGRLDEGAVADLVVFDRSAHWTVGPETLRTRGFGHPLAGLSLPGEVLLTVACGRVAYEAPAPD
jgi:dihydroorotase